MTLDKLGIWAAIVAGAIAAGALLFAIAKYARHKITFRHPVHACYLIPQAQYPYRLFMGAPARESKPKRLVIGVGQYRIINQFTVDANVNVDPFDLTFEGSDANKPVWDAPDNPFIVENLEYSGIKYRKDWWGNLHPFSPEVSTSYWYKTETRITGHRIATNGSWKGKVCFTIPIQGEKLYLVKLDLEVSAENDQVPFLKVERK